MKIHIKQATISDLSIIQKLNSEVFTDNSQYDSYLTMDWPFNPAGEKHFKKALTNKKYYCLIAEANNTLITRSETTKQSLIPVGYLVGCEKKISYRKVKMAEIDNMGVSPKFRSKGIGSKLITEFKKWAKSKGYQSVYVESYAANSRAIKFYKSNGLLPWSLGLEGKV